MNAVARRELDAWRRRFAWAGRYWAARDDMRRMQHWHASGAVLQRGDTERDRDIALIYFRCRLPSSIDCTRRALERCL